MCNSFLSFLIEYLRYSYFYYQTDLNRTFESIINCSHKLTSVLNSWLLNHFQNFYIHSFKINCPVSTGWVKNVISCTWWCKIVPFLCNSPVWGFLKIFFEIYIFWISIVPKKKPRNFFSLKIKSSEKEKV